MLSHFVSFLYAYEFEPIVKHSVYSMRILYACSLVKRCSEVKCNCVHPCKILIADEDTHFCADVLGQDYLSENGALCS